MSRLLTTAILLSCVLSAPSFAQNEDEEKAQSVVALLESPLYSPFVERYVLDELKQLRIDQAQTKQEMIQQIVDREHRSVDRAVSYATDTVTLFFLHDCGGDIRISVGRLDINEGY